MGTYRVAILGAGIGAAHLAAYLTLPERFRVAVICDRDAARARPLAAQASDARVETEIDRVLADPAVDLIDICLPPALHAPVAVAALDAGKAVVCEKPLALSLAEVDQVSAAARGAGHPVFPVFQYRYGLGMAQLRALIDAGLAGTPYAATLETHWNRGADYYGVPWRGTWAGEGGGAVLTHAIHSHDLLSCVFGPVARVSVLAATRVNPVEVEDCVAVAFEMANGAVATSSVSLGAADDTSRLRFLFEGFTAESGRAPYAPGAEAWTFTARAPARQADIDAVLAAVPEPPAGFAGFLAAVAAALDGHSDHAVTLADGRRSIELVTALYYAQRTGCAVGLPLNAGHPLYGGWRAGP